MEIMDDIDFNLINPRQGSKNVAFEELCCQLARRYSDLPLTRLHGAGGDGGIECYIDTEDGRVAWQAKYVFRVDNLIDQAKSSLDQALKIHPQLTRFILCFPFDLTGPTSRSGNSGVEKFEKWKNKQRELSEQREQSLAIETWSASEIRGLILEHDSSGGMREYFFGNIVLDGSWFDNHIAQIIRTAGPRYTPELNIETDVYKWFAAFSKEDCWAVELESKVNAFARSVREENNWNSFRLPNNQNHETPRWSGDTQNSTNSVLSNLDPVIELLRQGPKIDVGEYEKIISNLSDSVEKLRSIETELYSDIEERHGTGSANSLGWRQHMAEWMATFPAANLDSIRKLLKAVEFLKEWLLSPACSLAFCHTFVLSGEAGVGKTHGICDVAKRRQEAGLRSCIVFGHQFNNHPAPWSQVAKSLGLPANLGADQLLDCLNSAGEASGYPLLICVDAVNETKPRSYWKNNMASMSENVRQRNFLRLCFVCKTTYLTRCLQNRNDCLIVPHPGFRGIERLACREYFAHYNIQPPIAPFLQPELSNPLYLRLVCETLNNRGVDSVPSGWTGGGCVIVEEFLREKANKFSDEFETAPPHASTTCLELIAEEIATSGASSISRNKARSAVGSTVSDADAAINWLVGEGLLIEDWAEGRVLGHEIDVRLAFDRFGDFLIAWVISRQIFDESSETTSEISRLLNPRLKDEETIMSNQGILGELSVLIAERDSGVELTDLVDDIKTRDELRRIVIKALVYRTAESLTASTADLIYSTIRNAGLSYGEIDAILACSSRKSTIDAFWLDRLLRRYTLAQRDAFWSGYLHDRYQITSVVSNLISAVKELPLDDVETDISERWVVVLLWFTAAADRRIKDAATRSATKILTATTSIIPSIIDRFIDNDDDEIRERMLVSCYGALLLSRDMETTRQVALHLYQLYMTRPDHFGNALIRDHIRSICDFAVEISVNLLQNINPESITTETASRDWPLELPSDDDVNNWKELVRFQPNEFYSDFFKYSMNCLNPWTHEMSKEDMGKWILQRVARDFSYIVSNCSIYDRFMLSEYGGGRGKPVWAERIAKKYLWISLYQLASRLNDHLVRSLEPWEKGLPRKPLILLERRKLDPTIPERDTTTYKPETIWAFPTPSKLNQQLVSSYGDWMKNETVPTLDDLVQTNSYGGQRFKPIVAYFIWEGIEKQSESTQVYRRVCIHLHSYLVSSTNVEVAYESLLRRNLFDRRLPSAAEFCYGFIGEYPWGSVFDLSNYGQDKAEYSDEFPIRFEHSWSKVACSWEYDSTKTPNSVTVPSRQFFDGTLRWDGNGGFTDSTGTLVFLDPSVSSSDPPALLANVDFLDNHLKQKQLGLVWTMLGEKMVMDHAKLSDLDQIPRYTFSQVGYRNAGLECYGDFVKFEDYNDCRGPNTQPISG